MIESDPNHMDIYLEVPYLVKSKVAPKQEQVVALEDRLGYIYKVAGVFWPCFLKQCPYSNARFHYVDIRSQYEPHSENDENTSLQLTHNILDTYILTERLNKSLARLNNMIENPQPDLYIFDTNTLIDYFYTETRIDDLFDIYLTSENYVEDVRYLIKDLQTVDRQTLDKVEAVLFNPDMIVVADNKIMFRICAQIYALKKEGQHELIHKIMHFSQSKYGEYRKKYADLKSWHKLYEIYQQSLSESTSLPSTYSNLLYYAKPNTSIDALLVDIYTLSRLFRKFNAKKVIIYAGDFHIQHYKQFFEDYLKINFYGYVSPTYYRERQRCVYVPKYLFPHLT